ncbi:MAG TPA: hypothetical protein VL359_00975, partial [bacterium]|nr:hypothetical protein [bacterium]
MTPASSGAEGKRRTLPCPSCNAIARFTFRVGDRNRRMTPRQFDYFRCRRCGLVFLHPVPQDLALYYPPDYYMLPDTVEHLRPPAVQYEQYKVDLLRRFKQSGTLLEIGPGSGGFALLASEAGYEMTVLEMNQASCHFIGGNMP